MTRLVLALTSHGYGHAAQSAPVLEALKRRRPDLTIHIRSDLAPEMLRSFFPMADEVSAPVGDFGMAMLSSFDVDVPETERRYRALHAGWAGAVAAEADGLRGADLVLSNVSYLALAGAAQVGIPAVGFCSLDWLSIYRTYCSGMPEAERIAAEIEAAYRSAALFLVPEPSMSMPFPVRGVGPVARAGTPRPIERAPGERLVLVSLGGIRTEIDYGSWPRLPGIRYVIGGGMPPERPDMVALASLGISHLDCLWSVDALITKPGYGTMVEAACAGLPTLYASRETWPEEPALVAWLRSRVPLREVSRPALLAGDLGEALQWLLAEPRGTGVQATGAEEVASVLDRMIKSA